MARKKKVTCVRVSFLIKFVLALKVVRLPFKRQIQPAKFFFVYEISFVASVNEECFFSLEVDQVL